MTRYQPKPGDTIVSEIAFACPFCGIECQTGSRPTVFVLHVEPRCATFEELEPGEFLKRSRQHYEKEALRGLN